jgi:hypothetical protein
MYGTPDQVGESLNCPDCRTATVVPPLSNAAPPAPPVAQTDDDGYELWEGEGQPSPSLMPELFAYKCTVCQTRLYATLEQAGETTCCPDCFKEQVVPAPPKQLAKKPLEEDGPGYAVQEAAAVEQRVVETDFGTLRERGELLGYIDSRPRPPRWILLSGLGSFLLDWGVVISWIAVSSMLAVVLAVLGWAWQLASAGSLISVLGVLFLAFGSIITLLWLLLFAACGMAIVLDSAHGHRRIESWPEGMFIDWVDEAISLSASLFVGLLPGVLLSVSLALSGIPLAICMAVSGWLLWPLVLLSMLEGGALRSVLTAPVLRSLGTRCGSWLLFYLETAVCIAALAWALSRGANGLLALAAWSPVLVAAVYLELRLLGLLAWKCGDDGESTKQSRSTSSSHAPGEPEPPPIAAGSPGEPPVQRWRE